MAQNLLLERYAPGIYAIVNQAQVARPAQRQPSSTFFVVGTSPWGPTNTPTLVTSWTDYVSKFGSFDANSYMDDALYAFFNLYPGTRSWVCSVAGAAATKSTVTLMDRAGAPIATLRLDGKYFGDAGIYYTIENGSKANTFKLTVRASKLGNRKEIFDDLKVDADSIARVNQDSELVTLTNLASATAEPANLPALVAETLMAAGSRDFAGVSTATYVGTDDGVTKTGLQVFKSEEYGTGQVAIPGITAAAAHAALVAHADAWHRTALLDPPLGSDKAAVAAIRVLYDSFRAAIYWPWVKALDFGGANVNRFYPPSAFVAGECAYVDRNIGTHKAPANNMPIPTAIGVEDASNGSPQTDDATRDYMASRQINVITPRPGAGVRIYDEQVMSSDSRVTTVHQARMLNMIFYTGKRAYDHVPFSVIDPQGRLFRDLISIGRNFLQGLYDDGGLYGATPAEAFIVVADGTNNPPSELEAGRVHVSWGVRLSQSARIIFLHIDNVPLTQDLSVLQS